MGITIFSCIGVYLYQNTDTLSNLSSYLIAILGNIIVWLVTGIFVTKPILLRNMTSIKDLMTKISFNEVSDALKKLYQLDKANIDEFENTFNTLHYCQTYI